MFGRQVTLKLKANSATELNRIGETEILPILRKQKGFRDEMTFIAPGSTEVIAINLWDSREQADAYSSQSYPEVMRELTNVIEGTPRLQTYDVANSTPHNIAARAA